jgi:hypothetical protein
MTVFPCPSCNGPSRTLPGFNYKNRRERECKRCGERFTTSVGCSYNHGEQQLTRTERLTGAATIKRPYQKRNNEPADDPPDISTNTRQTKTPPAKIGGVPI